MAHGEPAKNAGNGSQCLKRFERIARRPPGIDALKRKPGIDVDENENIGERGNGTIFCEYFVLQPNIIFGRRLWVESVAARPLIGCGAVKIPIRDDEFSAF